MGNGGAAAMPPNLQTSDNSKNMKSAVDHQADVELGAVGVVEVGGGDNI